MRKFSKEVDHYETITTSELSDMSLEGILEFGMSLGLSLDGVDTKSAAIAMLCRSAVEFKNI